MEGEYATSLSVPRKILRFSSCRRLCLRLVCLLLVGGLLRLSFAEGPVLLLRICISSQSLPRVIVALRLLN